MRSHKESPLRLVAIFGLFVCAAHLFNLIPVCLFESGGHRRYWRGWPQVVSEVSAFPRRVLVNYLLVFRFIFFPTTAATFVFPFFYYFSFFFFAKTGKKNVMWKKTTQGRDSRLIVLPSLRLSLCVSFHMLLNFKEAISTRDSWIQLRKFSQAMVLESFPQYLRMGKPSLVRWPPG